MKKHPSSKKKDDKSDESDEDELPEELHHLDKELVKKIQNEIIESGETVTFDDIAGLDDVKQTVQEVVCWPMKRPDLFTGLRKAPNGLLLHGPPGTFIFTRQIFHMIARLIRAVSFLFVIRNFLSLFSLSPSLALAHRDW